MRELVPDDDKTYEARTRRDYFPRDDFNENKIIFTGLELYKTLKRKLLGEPEDRDAVREFERFLTEQFFGNKQVTLIPYEGESIVRVKIGTEKQLPIYQLGDGLQNLIICAFNIFMEKTRCLFFIEEPDLAMHPSLQRAFIAALSKCNQHQYFLTSHSNHFLDMTLDFSNISVFHFSKNEDDPTKYQIRVASSRDRNVLRDLGVRNSSVLLTNATIWVEGVTDRFYLRAYMSKYIKELEGLDGERAKALQELKEDYHYSFVEYQGANLTHWSFDPADEDAERIKASFVCAHAFLIADGDITNKGQREENYKAMLGDKFFMLPVKEIENLIPVDVLKEVVTDKFQKYNVNTNVIKYEDYSKEELGLGAYLDAQLKITEPVFEADSGTVKNKRTFCEKAVEFMNESDSHWDLTPAIRELCGKIYDHILVENKI